MAPAAERKRAGAKRQRKGWADELPSVDAVLESMSGTGTTDTTARQLAALATLDDYARARQRQVGGSDAKAGERRKEYIATRRALEAASPGAPTQATQYVDSLQFREDALGLFISKGSMMAYKRTPQYKQLRDDAPRQKHTP
jgi:hypothetical protein